MCVCFFDGTFSANSVRPPDLPQCNSVELFKFFGDLKHDTCLYVGKQLLKKKEPNNSAVCACLKSIWGDLSSDDKAKYFDCVILGNDSKKLNQRNADCSTTSLFLVSSVHGFERIFQSLTCGVRTVDFCFQNWNP